MNCIIVGAYWGDEGKGKIVDLLAKDCEWVVRFNGGDNAGHTIVIDDKKIVLHILPSGAIQGKNVGLGPDVFLNPKTLLEDIHEVEKNGYRLKGRLVIDERCHIIMPYHKLLDGSEETGTGTKIGTTRRGIGPASQDKASRRDDISFKDLISAEFENKVKKIVHSKKDLLKRNADEYTAEIIPEYKEYAKKLSKYAGSLTYELEDANGILMEAAQGTLLDLVHGTRPYVTSSNTTTGGAYANMGINPKKFRHIAIVKAYPTRVGEGPFPTELKDELGKQIQKDGAEFGATTGRPRQAGMPDFVALKYSCLVNSFDELAITKIDVLSGKKFTACIAYEKDGIQTDRFPFELTGWKPKYNGKTYQFDMKDPQKLINEGYASLPQGMKDFIEDMVKFVKVPVSMISIGPERDQTITKGVLEATKKCLGDCHE